MNEKESMMQVVRKVIAPLAGVFTLMVAALLAFLLHDETDKLPRPAPPMVVTPRQPGV
jgi:hypothetical protein